MASKVNVFDIKDAIRSHWESTDRMISSVLWISCGATATSDRLMINFTGGQGKYEMSFEDQVKFHKSIIIMMAVVRRIKTAHPTLVDVLDVEVNYANDDESVMVYTTDLSCDTCIRSGTYFKERILQD